MYGSGNKSPKVRLEDVMFYLDGLDKDGIESAGVSRRSGEILALRSQMLKLPDEAFDATMRTVRSLIEDENPRPLKERNAANDNKRKLGNELFESARPAMAAGRAAVSKVQGA